MSITLQGIEFAITGALNSSTADNIRKVRKELEGLKSTMSNAKLSQGYKDINNIGGTSNKKNETVGGEGSAASTAGSLANISARTRELELNFRKASGSSGQLLSSLKRIAMYRAIRTVVKEIGEGLREGVTNLYQFSKAGGDMGVFAASLDRISTATLYLKNAFGALVSPLINAIAPAIDFIIDPYGALVNVINQVIALLSGAGTWNRALKYPKEFAAAAGGASAKIKELKKTILGFDEINKLEKQNTSTGGGGTAAMDFSKMFETAELEGKFAKFNALLQAHMTEAQAILSGFEFVLGTILLLSGHPLIGLALMVHGASKLFALNATVDWGSITTEVANTLALMEGVVGGFSLALGVLLTVLGHPAIGVPMMLIGAAMAYQSMSVNWKAANSDITTALNSITGLALGALLAIGLVFTLLGHPALGIPLMLAGVVGIVATQVINWNSANTEVGKALQEIMQTIAGFLFVLGVIFFFTGNFPLGLGLMLAGGGTLLVTAQVDWDAIGKKIGKVADGIKEKWNKLKKDTEDIFNKLKEKVENVFSGFSKIHIPMPHFTWQTSGSGLFSFSYPKFTGFYAGGGFPEDGLFMANHNELVGQFSNGKTAVANNAQIVEGIRQGVKDANGDEVRLLREQNELLRQILAKEGTVEVPLSTITNAMARKNQRDGGTFVPVG